MTDKKPQTIEDRLKRYHLDQSPLDRLDSLNRRKRRITEDVRE